MGKGAVVLELDSCNVTLLTHEGVFLRLPAKRLPGVRHVGQHVDLADLKSPRCWRWVPVAAACLIILLVIPLLRLSPAQAWVTLDGSSSLEVLLDRDFRVQEVRGLNSAGLLFIEDYTESHDFSALMLSYLDWSAKAGDDQVLITSTASVHKINELVNQTEKSVDVIVIGTNSKAREEADRLGLSTGRALLAAEADGQGIDISPEQIKDGNPLTTLTAVGADIEKAVSNSSDPDTHVDKIRDLPKPDPSDDTFRKGNSSVAGRKGKATPPGQVGKETPPGQAAKLISRGKTYTPPPQEDKNLPPGLAKKAGQLPYSAAKKLGRQHDTAASIGDEERPGPSYRVSGINGNGNRNKNDNGINGNGNNGNRGNSGNGNNGNSGNSGNGNNGNRGNNGNNGPGSRGKNSNNGVGQGKGNKRP